MDNDGAFFLFVSTKSWSSLSPSPSPYTNKFTNRQYIHSLLLFSADDDYVVGVEGYRFLSLKSAVSGAFSKWSKRPFEIVETTIYIFFKHSERI